MESRKFLQTLSITRSCLYDYKHNALAAKERV